MFKSGEAYPCDERGEYVELDGDIVQIREVEDDTSRVVVKTKHGDFSVFTRTRPVVGCKAKIRVYRWAYIESQMIGWSRQ